MKFLEPIEADGCRFDRGMILFEFDAFREPEKTRFPKIGEWLKSKMEFNEIPTPKMYWRGKIWPDLFISNQLDALKSTGFYFKELYDEFLDPMCRKISGVPYSHMAPEYHRSIWLPEYWAKTLRARESLRTPFYYPKEGYAGAILPIIQPAERQALLRSDCETVTIALGLLVAQPLEVFSVMFIVDRDTPIYRVTDMDTCAGIETKWHRYVVEWRSSEWASVVDDLQKLNLIGEARSLSLSSVRLPLPTLENVRNGWKPAPNMNEQLWTLLTTQH